jgi:hypothetical protein
VGIVSWGLGPRYGIKWQAGMGVSDHSTVVVRAEQNFTSRRAAVAWIAGQLAEGNRPIHESVTTWAAKAAAATFGGAETSQ